MEHYLDNSATTRVYPQAAQKAYELMCENFGNPSSLHSKGMQAEDELISARRTISKSLGVSEDEIYFTSGGTESNNLALLGASHSRKKRGNKIVTTAIEHSSVTECAKFLEMQGFDVEYLKPDKKGKISASQFEKAIDKDTILVSAMAVNNETGSILPFDKISQIIKQNGSPALFHCDCVQAYCKIPLNLKKLSVDLASVSGHKVHAPKGVGALYIKDSIHIAPVRFGGEQESKIRPGTEALPLIAAFAQAVKMTDTEKNYEYVCDLSSYAEKKLREISGVTVNSPDDRLPYILNVSAGTIRSETMLHYLEQFEIYVSSGSACAKGKPSHVLQAMNIDKASADSAIRISFSGDNTKQDIDALCDRIADGLKTLIGR